LSHSLGISGDDSVISVATALDRHGNTATPSLIQSLTSSARQYCVVTPSAVRMSNQALAKRNKLRKALQT
jgi:hypothetical protein